jgi:hypothetical protein
MGSKGTEWLVKDGINDDGTRVPRGRSNMARIGCWGGTSARRCRFHALAVLEFQAA